MKYVLTTLIMFCISSAAFANAEMSLIEATAIEQIEQLHDSDDATLDIESKSEIATQKSKILIAGDSWAFFTCVYNSMGKMIRDKKAPLVEDNRCWRTSRTGLTAAEWTASRSHQRTLRFIQNTPRIKYLYLSLGGNDLMRNWNQDFTPGQELQLLETTTKTLKNIMDSYLAVRPDLTIILAGYDYPNFTFKFTLPLYRKIHKRMHEPQPERMNKLLVDFTQHVTKLVNGKNIFFIHSIGLSHYYNGVPEKGFAAKLTAPPEEISPMDDPGCVGGNVCLQTSKKSMINWLFILRDAFHLNTRMYRKVMHHAYDNLIVHLLRREEIQSKIQTQQTLQMAN